MDDVVREVGFYTAVTLILSSIFYLPWVLSSYAIIPDIPPIVVLLVTLGGVTPTIGAVVTVKKCYGDKSSFLFDAFKRKISPPVLAITLLLPPILFIATLGLSSLLGNSYDMSLINWATLIPIFLSSVIINVWEEIGWRGFALPRLQDKYGALVASVIVGLIWSLWHWPHFALKDSPMLARYGSVAIFVASTVLQSIIITWLYNSNNGSLIIPTLYHAMVNAAGITIMVNTGFTMDPLISIVVPLILVAVLVIIFRPQNLSTEQKTGVRQLLE